MWTCGHFEGVKHARGRATPSWLRETRTLVASFSTAAVLAISLTPAPVALGVSTTAAPRPRARREGDMREERVSSTQRRSDCTTRRNSKHRLASDVRGLACSPWDTVSVGGFRFHSGEMLFTVRLRATLGRPTSVAIRTRIHPRLLVRAAAEKKVNPAGA